MNKVVLMGHEATMKISGRAADPRTHWQQDGKIIVWLSFNEAVGGILSFAVELPAKEYKADEFLKLVQRKGEHKLRESLDKGEKDQFYYQAKEARQKELDELASRIEKSL